MYRDQYDLLGAHSLKSYLERQPEQTLVMLLETCNKEELDNYISSLILQILEERQKNC